MGVGEAGCTPPAHSLITDYVPKEKRAGAIAFYSIGTPLGTLAGMAMGGLVADAYGWRVAFMVAGAPGVLFALVAAFTLVEPRRQLAADLAARAASKISFGAALAVLATRRPSGWWPWPPRSRRSSATATRPSPPRSSSACTAPRWPSWPRASA